MPEPTSVERLNAEISRIVNTLEIKDAWGKQGAVPMTMTTEEFGRYLRQDIEKWAKVVQLSGAKVD